MIYLWIASIIVAFLLGMFTMSLFVTAKRADKMTYRDRDRDLQAAWRKK